MSRRCNDNKGFGTYTSFGLMFAGGLLGVFITAATALTGSEDRDGIPVDDLPRPLPMTVPVGLPPSLSEARPLAGEVTLGRSLFFDPILSSDRKIACASCHRPNHGFSDPRRVSPGVDGQKTLRNTPTLYNRALGKSFMWDGRAPTLREQVLLPIENELEMGLPVEEAVKRLQADSEWRLAFERAFGAPPQRDLLARSLEAFVSRLLYANSRVDRFQDGQVEALTAEERGGLWLFESRGACWKCHSGPNYTDEKFHNTGVGAQGREPEPGRFEVTGKASDRGRFKTPTLRGLTETGPYMHDGSLATIEEVVDFYRKGGHANRNLDPLIQRIEMSDQDARNLAAFLRALSRSPTR